MTTPLPLVRWGFGVSIIAVVVAVVIRLQQPLLGPEDASKGSGTKTYCYRGVRTHDDAHPSADCFTVAGGTFTDVFTRDSTAAGSEQDVLPGYVIPGLWDGHGHLLQYGEFLHSVDLFGSSSLEDVRQRLRAYVVAHPGAGTKDSWIRGIGWDQTTFGRMPTAVSTSLSCMAFLSEPARPILKDPATNHLHRMTSVKTRTWRTCT
jgi:hypothetical protein